VGIPQVCTSQGGYTTGVYLSGWVTSALRCTSGWVTSALRCTSGCGVPQVIPQGCTREACIPRGCTREACIPRGVHRVIIPGCQKSLAILVSFDQNGNYPPSVLKVVFTGCTSSTSTSETGDGQQDVLPPVYGPVWQEVREGYTPSMPATTTLTLTQPSLSPRLWAASLPLSVIKLIIP